MGDLDDEEPARLVRDLYDRARKAEARLDAIVRGVGPLVEAVRLADLDAIGDMRERLRIRDALPAAEQAIASSDTPRESSIGDLDCAHPTDCGAPICGCRRRDDKPPVLPEVPPCPISDGVLRGWRTGHHATLYAPHAHEEGSMRQALTWCVDTLRAREVGR